MIRAGIIGFSEGNGHPFSFSAIVNGYDELAFSKAGWPVIHEYLKLQPHENFGINGASITHAWSQNLKFTSTLCAACRIPNCCIDVDEMLGSVDALIIARDDWKSHLKLSLKFLKKGIPVFIDKPLTLDQEELKIFTPFLYNGMLMSCSGLRNALELDPIRELKPDIDSLKLISGTVLNGVDKYGIHLLEAVASLGNDFSCPDSIVRINAPHESFILSFKNGLPFHLNCLGEVAKTFHISFFGRSSHYYCDLLDNYNAFRRTMMQFFSMVETKIPAIDPSQTIRLMKILISASKLQQGETVHFNYSG